MEKGTSKTRSSFFDKASKRTSMNHQVKAMEWMENPFQNLHPRIFNKTAVGKIITKRKKDSAKNSRTGLGSTFPPSLSSYPNSLQSRLSSPVKTEHWLAERRLKQEGSLKAQFVKSDHDISHSSRRHRTKQAQREDPLFLPLLVVPKAPADNSNAVGNRTRDVSVTQPARSASFIPVPCKSSAAFRERRRDRSHGLNQLTHLDSRESLSWAYSSCLSINQGVKMKTRRNQRKGIQDSTSSFVFQTSVANSNPGEEIESRTSGDFRSHGDSYNERPLYHVTTRLSSPTFSSRLADSSERMRIGEVIVKPKLHRSCSIPKKYRRDDNKRLYIEDDDFSAFAESK